MPQRLCVGSCRGGNSRQPLRRSVVRSTKHTLPCRLAVVWIDWYAYHISRFRGLMAAPTLAGRVRGVELVGGVGVHAGLKFREDLPPDLPVETLLPQSDWASAGQLRLAVKLWQHLSRLAPDTGLVPGYYSLPAIAAALWAKIHGRASVLMTESTADDHTRIPWKETAKSLLLRTLFDSAVSGGRAHRRYLQQLGFPSDRIASFYDVVDNTAIAEGVRGLRQQASRDFGLPETYFLYVGRLAPEKNVRALIEAWLAYRNTGGTWPLVIAGDGPETPSLRQLAETSPFASEIHFAGHRSSNDLLPLYAFAACFILPSTREPWGLVVNEAMAAGLPVIVSKRCGCAEDLVEDAANGYTFDPAEEGQLVASLHTISHAPPASLADMRARSWARIQNYSPENFGLEVAALTQPVPELRATFS